MAKALMMFVALGVVIYGIRTLKSSEFTQTSNDPNNALSLLLGSDVRPLNWCFGKTTKLEILADDGSVQRTLEKASEISSLCETMISGVTADQLAQAVFVRRLVARGEEKGEKVLEQSKQGGIFRSQGLPFTSPMLEKALQRFMGPGSP